MKNLTDEIKNDFLILGFTGPLRSGCTTAANFFSKSLHKNFKQFFTSDRDKEIHYNYQKIGECRSQNNYGDEIDNALRSIKYAAIEREVLGVLEKSVQHDFCHISMSVILLKYAKESLLQGTDAPPKYAKIGAVLQAIAVDQVVIEKINKLRKKEITLAEVMKEDYAKYDEYLRDLELAMDSLKSSVGLEERIGLLQDMGDNVRRCGNPFEDNSEVVERKFVTVLASEANNLIKYYKNRNDGHQKTHFAIDAFRNPHEVEYFRYRYSEFYLFSITAESTIRSTRNQYVKDIDNRDSGKDISQLDIHKLNVSKCVYLSDIQIDNSENADEHVSFYQKLLYYASLIQSPGCVPPTTHELFMSQAYGLSLKSTCISRQVGAVIVGVNGYVVGAGWNDVGAGQIGCGLRRVSDVRATDNDDLPLHPAPESAFRDELSKKEKKEYFCFKDEYSKYEIGKKISAFKHKGLNDSDLAGISPDDIETVAKVQGRYIKIKRLEFCRALHAEENALLQSAKIGGVGVKGGTIYTTYFPCELCSKKIYQSGITEIVYTEPYPDSVAQDVILRDGTRNIKLTPFEGVKSHSFFRLYKGPLDKKELQEIERA
jgi:deoxycytidylate deaminase